MPCGTTGESPTLSHDEHKEVIRHTIEVVDKRITVIAGTGSNSTEEAIELSKFAEKAGSDALLIVTPYYNKPNQEGIFQHFLAVSQSTDAPICVYDVPGRTSRAIAPATFARLAEIPNIVAVKDATADMAHASEVALATHHGLQMLSGDDFTLLPFLALGGHGAISVLSNVAPRRTSRMVRAARAGDLATARDLHFELYPLIKLLFEDSNPTPIKAALAELGLMDSHVRLPLTPATPGLRRRLGQALGRLGIEVSGGSR